MHRSKLSGILIYLFMWMVEGKRNYIVNITKFTCEHNSSVVKSFKCELERAAWRPGCSGYVILQEPIKQATAHAVMYISTAKRKNFKLLDLTLDGCKALETISEVPFLNQFKTLVLRYSNAVPRCPGIIGFNYTLTNFHYDEEVFPSYVPEATFKFSIRAFVNNDSSHSGLYTGVADTVYIKNAKKKNRG